MNKDKKRVPLKEPTDSQLAARIVAAIKACDSADATSKEKAVQAGRLLDDAHKRYPTDETFTEFLETKMDGRVGLRRAQDLIAIFKDPEIFPTATRPTSGGAISRRPKRPNERPRMRLTHLGMRWLRWPRHRSRRRSCRPRCTWSRRPVVSLCLPASSRRSSRRRPRSRPAGLTQTHRVIGARGKTAKTPSPKPT
jgi:hypothetical protein